MFDLKEKFKSIKTLIPTLYYAMKNKKTPCLPKLLAALTVAYALSPIDLISDFIPVIGYIDDLIILPILITLTIKLIPKSILEECRRHAISAHENQLKKKWIYALPILIIYLFVIVWIVSIIFSMLLH